MPITVWCSHMHLFTDTHTHTHKRIYLQNRGGTLKGAVSAAFKWPHLLLEPKIIFHNSIFSPNVRRNIIQLELYCSKSSGSSCKLRSWDCLPIPSYLEWSVRNKKICDQCQSWSSWVIRPKCSVYRWGDGSSEEEHGSLMATEPGMEEWGLELVSHLSGLKLLGAFINKHLQSTCRCKAVSQDTKTSKVLALQVYWGHNKPHGNWNMWDSCIDEDEKGALQEPKEETPKDGAGGRRVTEASQRSVSWCFVPQTRKKLSYVGEGRRNRTARAACAKAQRRYWA